MHDQAILPAAACYEGANGGTINVGGGTIANALVQTTDFPSASSSTASLGIEQVRASC